MNAMPIFNMKKALMCLGVGLALTPISGYATCSDIVMRMQDPNHDEKTKGREITMFLNCHEGSYQFPAATTVHMFEWKSGKLCQNTRSCGNVKYWNGHFNIGAAWTWGNSVSDILSNVSTLNNFKKLADGSNPSPGGSVTGNTINQTCIQTSSPHVKNIGSSGDANAFCYQKSLLSTDQWQRLETDWTRAGAVIDTAVNLSSPDVTHVCLGGPKTGPGIGNYSGNTENFHLSSCNQGTAILAGGAGGSGYSPIFGIESGTQTTSTNVNTDWNQTTLHINFALNFGQIERYCAAPQDEVCF